MISVILVGLKIINDKSSVANLPTRRLGFN